MADEIDLANDLMETEVSYALNKLRQMTPKNVEGAEFCDECGDNIPAARQQLGYRLCVTCAEQSERRQSRYAN